MEYKKVLFLLILCLAVQTGTPRKSFGNHHQRFSESPNRFHHSNIFDRDNLQKSLIQQHKQLTPADSSSEDEGAGERLRTELGSSENKPQSLNKLRTFNQESETSQQSFRTHPHFQIRTQVIKSLPQIIKLKASEEQFGKTHRLQKSDKIQKVFPAVLEFKESLDEDKPEVRFFDSGVRFDTKEKDFAQENSKEKLKDHRNSFSLSTNAKESLEEQEELRNSQKFETKQKDSNEKQDQIESRRESAKTFRGFPASNRPSTHLASRNDRFLDFRTKFQNPQNFLPNDRNQERFGQHQRQFVDSEEKTNESSEEKDQHQEFHEETVDSEDQTRQTEKSRTFNKNSGSSEQAQQFKFSEQFSHKFDNFKNNDAETKQFVRKFDSSEKSTNKFDSDKEFNHKFDSSEQSSKSKFSDQRSQKTDSSEKFDSPKFTHDTKSALKSTFHSNIQSNQRIFSPKQFSHKFNSQREDHSADSSEKSELEQKKFQTSFLNIKSNRFAGQTHLDKSDDDESHQRFRTRTREGFQHTFQTKALEPAEDEELNQKLQTQSEEQEFERDSHFHQREQSQSEEEELGRDSHHQGEKSQFDEGKFERGFQSHQREQSQSEEEGFRRDSQFHRGVKSQFDEEEFKRGFQPHQRAQSQSEEDEFRRDSKFHQGVKSQFDEEEFKRGFQSHQREQSQSEGEEKRDFKFHQGVKSQFDEEEFKRDFQSDQGAKSQSEEEFGRDFQFHQEEKSKFDEDERGFQKHQRTQSQSEEEESERGSRLQSHNFNEQKFDKPFRFHEPEKKSHLQTLGKTKSFHPPQTVSHFLHQRHKVIDEAESSEKQIIQHKQRPSPIFKSKPNQIVSQKTHFDRSDEQESQSKKKEFQRDSQVQFQDSNEQDFDEGHKFRPSDKLFKPQELSHPIPRHQQQRPTAYEHFKQQPVLQSQPRHKAQSVPQFQEVQHITVDRHNQDKSYPEVRSHSQRFGSDTELILTKPAKYSYDYRVHDSDTGSTFGRQEQRDTDQTQGFYYVHLPDGRLQRVSYYVNGDSGYVAKVSYEGGGNLVSRKDGY